MSSKDILIGSDGDLLIANGDFVIGDSDEQHIADIMLATKGDFRNSPLTGCNLAEFVKANNTAEMREQLRQRIRTQLEFDGYRLDSLTIKDNLTTTIKASKP